MRSSRSTRLRPGTTGGCAVVFLLVWLSGWSAITLTFDGFIAYSIAKQSHSGSFPSTAGSITHSEVVESRDSEGVSYSLEIEYAYEVSGVEYQNDLYRYGFETSGEHDVRRIVKEHPVGSAVDVFYNPANPEDALLSPGLTWFDWFMPLFMVPFNLIMIGMFSFTIGTGLRSWLGRRPRQIQIRQRDVSWQIKAYEWLPIVAAGITALAVSFVSIFVVGFGQLVLPGEWLVIPAWICVLGLSLLAFFKTQPAAIAELDEYQQRATFHLKRLHEPIVVNYAEVEWVRAKQKRAVLKTTSREISIPCGSERAAQWLAAWLSGHFGTE